jgi:Zn-dependent M28 family amino/carboxypeptidase
MEHRWKSQSWMKNCLMVSTIVLTAAALIGCRPGVDEIARPANGITAEDLATYTRELADDSMLGRAPGGEGEAPTLAYLQAAYERIGLRPMGDSSLPGSVPGSPPFFQKVELVGITADPSTAGLTFKGSAQSEALELKYGSDFVTWTPEPGATLDVSGNLVFVGYGINAPEEGWNDYRGVDVTEKIVLVLVGDPPLEDQSRFGGKAMTYYGRYTYKLEEAARRGAAGVLIIHSTEAAGYGWNVVQSTWMGEQLNFPANPDATPPVPLQGWVSRDAAGQILTSAGFNLDELAAAAAREGFVPIQSGTVGVGHLDTATRPVTSYNVVGAVEGSDPNVANEYIIFMAHWDHFGIGEPVDGDTIYNGALDNAVGVASMLEVAEAWALAQPAPRRSALFIATTAEEAGLLGATHYVKNPHVPLEETLAVINIDTVNVWGPTEDLSGTGLGQSTLDDDLTAVLSGQGRSLTPDSEPEKGYYFRADHFPFAQAGVPAVSPWSGERFVGKPEDFAQRVWEEYDANHYHQPSDEFDPSWDFSGAAQDVEALLQVGLRVSAADTWPEWRSGSEFKAARDAMLEDRKP